MKGNFIQTPVELPKKINMKKININLTLVKIIPDISFKLLLSVHLSAMFGKITDILDILSEYLLLIHDKNVL